MPSLTQTKAFLERERKARFQELIIQSQKEKPFLWSLLREFNYRATDDRILKLINALPDILEKDAQRLDNPPVS